MQSLYEISIEYVQSRRYEMKRTWNGEVVEEGDHILHPTYFQNFVICV